tara:strand:- start:1332 stop:1475 length:144 start_codon:yes stop_codon:yes gene_type:complete
MAMTYGSIDKPKIIIIEVQGGCVINVSGMPQGYTYEIKDNDVNKEEE